MHPLSGADLATLSHVFRGVGPLAPQARTKAMGIWGAALGRLPFTLAERAWLSGRLPSLEAMPAPVFILGHWRSGTTHLYQVMVEADFGFVPPAATGLPWDLFLIGKLFRKQIEARLPAKRYIDNIPVKPDSPQEDEIALANMSRLSFYHGIYFPRHMQRFVDQGVFFDGVDARAQAQWDATFTYFLRKLFLHQGRKRLLIKNPVYTARMAHLQGLLPGAKFLHIHRDPVDVFLSMRNFYSKLLKEFALQDAAGLDIDELVLSTYARMMSALERDSARAPPGSFAQIRYEDFTANPLPELERVWAELDLGDFAQWQPRFAAYLESVRGFEKNQFARDAGVASMVAARLPHWHALYRKPAS